MGQTLSEPVTAKETSICGNANMRVASSCMQGWRINMEDAHVQMLAVPGDKDASFFAVFDGHGENLALFDPDTSHLSGVSPQSIFSRRTRSYPQPSPGARVAQYAGIHLHKKIISDPAYAEGQVEEAIRRGFLATDEDMLNDDSMKEELAGTTAVIVLIKNSKIYCGNVGDSRVIASVKGEVQQLSFDHKPSNEAETKRIIAAGGWVEFNRVNGNLALSRALGDFVFKKNDTKKPEEQIVTAQPDVVVRDLTEDHEFLVLACDGIWDVLSNQEVVDFVRGRIAQKIEPETICEELMMRCLAPDCQMGGLGCDNMTVVLVCFLHANTYENLANMCSRPCSHAHLMPSSQQSDTDGDSMEESLE